MNRPVVEEFQVPVSYCVNRPVYEQHVRDDPVHDLPAGGRSRTRSRSRTACSGRSTSSTSAQQRYTTYRTETQQYQVAIPYTTYKPVHEAADLLRAGHDLPHGDRLRARRQRVSYVQEPVVTERRREGLHRPLRDGDASASPARW